MINYGLYCFTEDTLWTGTPGNYTNPEAPEALEEVRKLVDDGDFSEATEKADKLTGNPSEVFFFSSYFISILISMMLLTVSVVRVIITCPNHFSSQHTLILATS